MPNEADHLTQAKNNEDFCTFLLSAAEDRFLGWAVTSVFYAAVHYGRAFLRSRNIPDMTSHLGFETHFLRVSGDQRLYNLYRRLKDDSERARYDCVKFTQNEISTLEQNYLIPFRDTLASLRGPKP